MWLAFNGLSGDAVFELDGQPIDPVGDPPRLEITGRLQPTCEIVVDLRCDPSGTDDPLGLHGFVTIEIESPDD